MLCGAFWLLDLAENGGSLPQRLLSSDYHCRAQGQCVV